MRLPGLSGFFFPGPMKLLAKPYDLLLYAMAWLAGLLLVGMMVTITIDVVLRNPPFNMQTSAWLFTFTEYALLLVPCLGAPWLVREKGHVFVEILLINLSPGKRFLASRFVAVFCIVVCAILAWYGFEVAIRDYTESRQDTRAFDFPRWILVVWIPVAFLMMAIEFARFLVRREQFLTSLAAGGTPAE